jgi:hypothetical protein
MIMFISSCFGAVLDKKRSYSLDMWKTKMHARLNSVHNLLILNSTKIRDEISTTYECSE